MVADLEALDHYPWTGHAVLLGNRQRPWQDSDCVLSQFGTPVGAARRAYRAFVADGLHSRSPIWMGVACGAAWGCGRPLPTVTRGRERWAFDERILGQTDFVTRVIAASDAQPPPDNCSRPVCVPE